MAKGSEKTQGNELLGKLTDIFSKTDKGLDQVKKSVQEDLNSLKREKNFENLATNLYWSALEGFVKDLEELGIYGEQQTEYLHEFESKWETMSMKSKAKEIVESPELKGLDEFITEIENLPKLQEVMASAEPKAKWHSMLDGIAIKYLGYKPGDPESETMMAGVKEWLASTFGLGFLVKKGAEAKPAENQNGQTTPNQAAPTVAASTPSEETPAPNAETGDNKDQETLAKNFEVYKKVLDQTSPSPDFEELLAARTNESKLFEGMKGKDLEAQVEAVDKFMIDKLAKVGEVESIQADEIIFKPRAGETEDRHFQLTRNVTGDHFVSRENQSPVKFNGDLASLVAALESLEKNPNS